MAEIERVDIVKLTTSTYELGLIASALAYMICNDLYSTDKRTDDAGKILDVINDVTDGF